MRLLQCGSAATSFTGFTQTRAGAVVHLLNTRWRYRLKDDIFSNSVSIQILALRVFTNPGSDSGNDTIFPSPSSSFSLGVLENSPLPVYLNAPRTGRLHALCCPGTFLFGLDVILCLQQLGGVIGQDAKLTRYKSRIQAGWDVKTAATLC